MVGRSGEPRVGRGSEGGRLGRSQSIQSKATSQLIGWVWKEATEGSLVRRLTTR